jgi:hypothetical protein
MTVYGRDHFIYPGTRQLFYVFPVAKKARICLKLYNFVAKAPGIADNLDYVFPYGGFPSRKDDLGRTVLSGFKQFV